MIRTTTMIALAGAAAALGFGTAVAKEYVDYSPAKGVWEINAVDVDPNHIDDYLTGLRQSQVPGFEVLRKHGLIDDYKFLVRQGYAKGNPSVLIMVHYTSMAALEPNKARDQALDQEIYAKFSEDAGKTAVAGYEKYRSFVDNSFYTEQTIAK